MGQDSTRRKLVAESFSQNHRTISFARPQRLGRPDPGQLWRELITSGADVPSDDFYRNGGVYFSIFFFPETQFVLPFFDAGARATPLNKFLAQIA
jgi:hypothetical protein